MTTTNTTDRSEGARAYLAAHAQIGNSEHSALNLAAARSAAQYRWERGYIQDRDGFVAGWMGERARHFAERARYYTAARVAFVPLPGL